MKSPNTITAILNQFPEVRWDRLAGEVGAWSGRLVPQRFAVFGWIDREDNHKDFLLLVIEEGDVAMFATSSAKYSPIFSQRLGLSDDGEHKCQRIEHLLPFVTNVVKLDA